MKQFYHITFVLILGFAIISCRKDDPEISEHDIMLQHYFPLIEENYWNYDASKDYSITIVGKKRIGDKEYYILDNSINTGNMYARYDANKLFFLNEYNGVSFELLALDEDAAEGGTWHAGTLSMSQEMFYSFSASANCTLLNRFSSYNLDGVVYTDVIEIGMVITLDEFEVSSYLDREMAAQFELYKESMLDILHEGIVQHFFYAKGVGQIYEYIEGDDQSRAVLTEYSIK